MGMKAATTETGSFSAFASRWERRPGLAKRTRRLAWTSVLTLLGRSEDLEECLRYSLARRTSADDLREAVLTAMLFSGYPRAIHALEVLSETLAERGEAPPPRREFPAGRAPGNGFFLARGERLFQTIYGDDTDRVRERIAGFHPDLMDWILADAYGKVLARPALALVIRETLAVALLAALSLPRQLTSHIRGALAAGASRRALAEAIRQSAPFLPPENVRAALARLARERDRR